MSQCLSRDCSLAEHRHATGATMQRLYQSDQHPLGNIEVGFPSLGGEALTPLEVCLFGEIVASEDAEGGIRNPRGVTYHENGSTERRKELNPINLEEVPAFKMCLPPALFRYGL